MENLKLIFIWQLSDQIRVPISSWENKFPIERFIIHLSHRVELSKIDAWRHGRQESRKWSSWNLKSWDLQNLGPEMLLSGWWFRSQNSKQTSLLTQRQTVAGSLLLGYHRPMFPDCSIHWNWLKQLLKIFWWFFLLIIYHQNIFVKFLWNISWKLARVSPVCGPGWVGRPGDLGLWEGERRVISQQTPLCQTVET